MQIFVPVGMQNSVTLNNFLEIPKLQDLNISETLATTIYKDIDRVLVIHKEESIFGVGTCVAILE